MTTRDFQTRKPISILFSYFKPHRGLFILDLVCATIVALIDLAFPLVTRKAKSEGMTDEEREEQAQLRRDYIDSVKANLKSQLDSLYVLDEKSGKKTKIVDFERERAARAGKKKENR